MRRIRKKEREKAGNIYCDHCKPLKIDAIYRLEGIGASHQFGDFACEKHKHLIRKDDNEKLTEADYQTWMRL